MTNLVEQTRQYLNETPDDLETEFLNEVVSLRTGAIVVGLGKVKQYANKIDQEVTKLKRDASDLRKSSPEDAPSHIADALDAMGKLFYLQRKMQMYSALTTAATGIGVDKSNKILKKLERKR